MAERGAPLDVMDAGPVVLDPIETPEYMLLLGVVVLDILVSECEEDWDWSDDVEEAEWGRGVW